MEKIIKEILYVKLAEVLLNVDEQTLKTLKWECKKYAAILDFNVAGVFLMISNVYILCKPTIQLLGIYWGKKKTNVNTKMYTQVYRSSVWNQQNLET